MKKCHGDYRWASEIFHPTYEGNEILLIGLINFTEDMIYTAINITQIIKLQFKERLKYQHFYFII